MNPLVELWRREIDGMAAMAIVDMWVHGPAMVALVAEGALARGVSPEVVAKAVAEAERRTLDFEASK